jgi:hypothetical protein
MIECISCGGEDDDDDDLLGLSAELGSESEL